MIIYDAIADLVVTIHAAYVGFVVLDFTAIVLGSAMGWRWVHNLYFRVAHLAAILLVCLEALIGVPCPLDDAGESAARARQGQAVRGSVRRSSARSAGLL